MVHHCASDFQASQRLVTQVAHGRGQAHNCVTKRALRFGCFGVIEHDLCFELFKLGRTRANRALQSWLGATGRSSRSHEEVKEECNDDRRSYGYDDDECSTRLWFFETAILSCHNGTNSTCPARSQSIVPAH